MAQRPDPEPLPASIPISSRRRIEDEILRILVESVQDYAIFMLSPDGTVGSWNVGAERIKGYRADEIIGRHFSVFYQEDDIASGKPQADLDRAARDGRVEYEGWRVRRDGMAFWATIVINALYDQRGSLVGFGKVTRDLTETRLLEETRQSFITNAAHELRTPLTVLVGMITFLQSAPEVATGEALTEHLETLGRQADRMHSLVNNLLDLTKLEQGRDRFALEPVDLSNSFERLLVAYPPPDGKHVVRDLGGLAVLAEPRRLDQVFANLLINAYRHGGEFIVIRAWDEGDAIAIKVQDDGAGVEASIADSLFEPFQRGQGKAVVEGSGLGLAIVKGFVESFGGTVAVDPTTEGARFVVRLQKVDG
jgi:PAS domain S-box-containing protein